MKCPHAGFHVSFMPGSDLASLFGFRLDRQPQFQPSNPTLKFLLQVFHAKNEYNRNFNSKF